MIDVRAVREAAEAVVGDLQSYPADSPAWLVAYTCAALTSPTPLTPTLLWILGGRLKEGSDWVYTFGDLTVYPDGPVNSWSWEYRNITLPKELRPRTEGKLLALLTMLQMS